MRIDSDYLRLLAWMGGGGAIGVVLGVAVAAFFNGLVSMPFILGAFGSYLGMLVGDRRRLARRRPGQGGGAAGPAARKVRREARSARVQRPPRPR
ncbi:MAG TPA: hypothetical protein VF763_01690 [Candidatus Limnocylindrales bacterium]